MSLVDAIVRAGRMPASDAKQSVKKRYSELLSRHLAQEVAEGLRRVGFAGIRPYREGPAEKAFQGGLGPKKVDVTFSDERHGLLLAVSIKTISAPPFGKNLRNRFADLCTEAITLHMRFPYGVICALFAFPEAAGNDTTAARHVSTCDRAIELFATISGREDHTDPPEKFENFTVMLYRPVGDSQPWVKLFDSQTRKETVERKYFQLLREIYQRRNPQALLDEE